MTKVERACSERGDQVSCALQNTLWPEAYKLYGHGDMLYCCAASPDGAYVASACVAKSEAQAAVWVWDVAGGTWKGVAQLQVRRVQAVVASGDVLVRRAHREGKER